MGAKDPSWNWLNLPGGFSEKVVGDFCSTALADAGCALGRGCVLVQTNATSAFRVIFSETSTLPIRDSDNPALTFVVGKRKNSITTVGFGSPYPKKEPIESTKSPDALLSSSSEQSRTFWFAYDKEVGALAMGVLYPQPDLCRLVCRFPSDGFRRELCENLRYVVISSGKKPVSVNVQQIIPPAELFIPQYKFCPRTWCSLPWYGNGVIFRLPEEHRKMMVEAQQILMASPIAELYALVEPQMICLHAYPMLDQLHPGIREIFPDEDPEDVDWPRRHEAVHRRVAPILSSADWTYWPLRFDRVDCTHVHLAPTGERCQKAIKSWLKAVEDSTGLRSTKTPREILSFVFAFEVFPVVGEHNQQARRDVVRKVTEHLSAKWGVCEFAAPEFVCWQTHTDFHAYKP